MRLCGQNLRVAKDRFAMEEEKKKLRAMSDIWQADLLQNVLPFWSAPVNEPFEGSALVV